jgi:hypothetical protein
MKGRQGWAKGESGNPTGRKKNTPNRIAKGTVEDFFWTWDKLGGRKAFLALCKSDPAFAKRCFYATYCDLVRQSAGNTVKIEGANGDPVTFIIQNFKRDENSKPAL